MVSSQQTLKVTLENCLLGKKNTLENCLFSSAVYIALYKRFRKFLFFFIILLRLFKWNIISTLREITFKMTPTCLSEYVRGMQLILLYAYTFFSVYTYILAPYTLFFVSCPIINIIITIKNIIIIYYYYHKYYYYNFWLYALKN